jgi:hypothetical protein
LATDNVCFWHKADVLKASPNVRFSAYCGHRKPFVRIASSRPTTTTATASPRRQAAGSAHRAGSHRHRITVTTTLADIKPSFKDDTDIVPIPPEEAAFSNCEKVVERDVEVYRKKA